MILPVIEVTVGPPAFERLPLPGRDKPGRIILSETRIRCDILTGDYLVTISDFLVTSARESKVCQRLRREISTAVRRVVRLWQFSEVRNVRFSTASPAAKGRSRRVAV